MPADPLNVFLIVDCTSVLFFNPFNMSLFALLPGAGEAL